MTEVQTDPTGSSTGRAIRAAVNPRTRGILINSPSNPTGIVMGEKNLAEIAVRRPVRPFRRDLHLVYEGRGAVDPGVHRQGVRHKRIFEALRHDRVEARVPDLPREFSSVMERMHQSFMISANNFVQYAGIAALRSARPDIERMKATYNERRMYMIRRLREMGFVIHVEPTGAFYVYADAGAFFTDTYAAAFDILEKAGVGVTPGVDFGSGQERFIRFSYANSIGNIREGLDRIQEYLRRK